MATHPGSGGRGRSPGAAAAEAPLDAPSRIEIAPPPEPGDRLTVSGRVVDGDGRPVPRASIYFYHTDTKGEYSPGRAGGAGSGAPRLFGYLRSDGDGRYAIATIKPGSYPGSRNPAHIHFEIVAAGYLTRYYEIVFEDDPFLSAAFRAQARDPFGSVAVVSVSRDQRGIETIRHDIRVRMGAGR